MRNHQPCPSMNFFFGIIFLYIGQCWALPQIDPLIRKLRFQGLVCRFANRFLTASICGFAIKIEIYRKAANHQHRGNLNRLCNFQKYAFLQFNVSTNLGGCICKVQRPLTKFLCFGMIIFYGCCLSYSKMS